MPYAKNGDVNIYYEVEGEGEPLVLLHGGGASLESWRGAGYVEALKQDYQIILIDERGQGKSDKPHDSESYNIEYRVSDVTIVLDNLGIISSHFFGYSYGGRICLECARFVPDRVKSLIIGGMGPMGKTPDGSNPVLQLYAAGPDALIANLEQSGPLPADLKAQFLANDFDAMVAILKSPWPNLEEYLPDMNMAALIIIGESDKLWPFKEIGESYRVLTNMTFISLPNLDHGEAFIRSDQVLPHIKEFLTKVIK
ncbi:alpha/beta fold hydrolase [Chloroflexota bacterium]